MMLGTIVGIARFTDAVNAPIKGIEIAGAIQIQITDAAEVTEWVKAHAAFRANHYRATEFIKVDSPRFDNIKANTTCQPNEAQAEFFYIIIAELGAFIIHRDFLMGLTGYGQGCGVAQQVKN